MDKQTPAQIQQLFWMDKAKKYVEENTKGSPQYVADALYVAYLSGVEAALGIRIIN
jgi:hypothetical protein